MGLPVGWLYGSRSAPGDFTVEQKGKTSSHPEMYRHNKRAESVGQKWLPCGSVSELHKD